MLVYVRRRSGNCRDQVSGGLATAEQSRLTGNFDAAATLNSVREIAFEYFSRLSERH